MTTKTTRKAGRHIESDFDEFIRGEGIYDPSETLAIKRVLA